MKVTKQGVAKVDVNESINMNIVKALEENGYLAEARKRVAAQALR
jgi:hypothetical protein